MQNLPDADGAPCVKLGGKEWKVPLLNIRQNRVIDPLILKLLPIFSRWQSDPVHALSSLDASHYDALIDIAFCAVRRMEPALDKEAFLDLPITLPELVVAFSVIAEQTGIFRKDEVASDLPGER